MSHLLSCFLVDPKLDFPVGSLAQFLAYFKSEIKWRLDSSIFN